MEIPDLIGLNITIFIEKVDSLLFIKISEKSEETSSHHSLESNEYLITKIITPAKLESNNFNNSGILSFLNNLFY